MSPPPHSIVTGAYSFTGKYIARRLLDLGEEVKTLTGHPHREHPFGDAVPWAPLQFEDRAALIDSMAGAQTLYNTYWIRFERGETTFEAAVANTATLLEAARSAGVRNLVHISIVHADEQSPLAYFRAKGRAERVVRESGLRYAILRPTVLFGPGSLLFNNIAWMLRRFPVFAVPGDGTYRLQPVCVDDLAEQAVGAAHQEGPRIRDVAGPDILAFAEIIRLIGELAGLRTRLLRVRLARVLKMVRAIDGIVNDVVLTEDELRGLQEELLLSGEKPPRGTTSFRAWLERNAEQLGRRYFSELERHYRPDS